MKKKIRPAIDDWDSKTLSKWMGEVGFPECMNIIKFGNITGWMMARGDYRWLSSDLGITDENKCSKLKGEVDKVRTTAMEDCSLFGWGNNAHG